MRVRELLQEKTGGVHTVGWNESVPAAARLLSDRRIGILVVLDDKGHVLGVLSERDIVFGVAGNCENLSKMRVDDLMSRRFASCSPEDTAEAAMEVMAERHVRHLPVIENEVLKGLISITDVLKHRFDACEIDSSALRDYIASVGYH